MTYQSVTIEEVKVDVELFKGFWEGCKEQQDCTAMLEKDITYATLFIEELGVEVGDTESTATDPEDITRLNISSWYGKLSDLEKDWFLIISSGFAWIGFQAATQTSQPPPSDSPAHEVWCLLYPKHPSCQADQDDDVYLIRCGHRHET